MADSNFRGPVNSMGALEVQGATTAVEPFDGPSLFYQGIAAPDIRSAPFAKDGTAPARQVSFLSATNIWACDNIPSARNATAIATSQVATNALAMSLQTVGGAGVASACSIAVGVPIIPIGTTVATNVIAIDFGFTTGTTTAGSTTVAVVDNTLLHLGQWIVIGNVGNAAATRSHIAQVVAIATANTTGLTISPAAVTGLASVPIGQANLFGSGLLPPATQFGPAAASANAHSFAGAMAGGLGRVMNPRETIARNLVLTAATSDNFSAIVSGWDVWGNAMTELITMTAQTTVAGKKAFKYLGSVVSGTGSTNPVSIGLGDTFGFPLRVDEWDQTETTWNNSFASSSNGFTAAVLTSPATNSTGDIRGTVQISTAILTGVLATAVSAVASNGTSRVTMLQRIGVWNMIAGTPVNTIPMFGVAQSTT